MRVTLSIDSGPVARERPDVVNRTPKLIERPSLCGRLTLQTLDESKPLRSRGRLNETFRLKGRRCTLSFNQLGG